jgi:3-phenylpropionate/trans-cinnamate dioxygenase ferredoxin reductase subunit
MNEFTYIIIGGGLAADAAAKGIRERDSENSIAIFTSEADPPYTRPALSKKLWLGKPIEKIWRNTSELGVDIFLNATIKSINPGLSQISTNKENTYKYSKLFLATGGRPRKLEPSIPSVIYFRDLSDYRQLRTLVDQRKSITIIGGGFIGSELAAALVQNNVSVSMVFPELGICSRIFPSSISDQINQIFSTKGVNVLSQTTITKIIPSQKGLSVAIKQNNGTSLKITSDAVVAGIGLLPNTDLAEDAGLLVENGIKVNEYLQTSNSNIYAGGDVANYFDFSLKTNRRVEHEDNAIMMGLTAGHNMTGEEEKYTHLPYFYSDLFNIGYEAVGDLDSRLDVFIDWEIPFEKGILYYLNNKIIRGILFWNIWGKLDQARFVITEGKSYTDKELGSLFK